MARLGMYLLEFFGLVGMVGLVAYISWTKMALGAVLTMIGALFPQCTGDSQSGQGTVKFANASAVLKGSLRVGMVLGGIVLLIGAVLDGYEGYREKSRQRALIGIERLKDRYRSVVAEMQEEDSDQVNPEERKRSMEAYEELLDKYRSQLQDQGQDSPQHTREPEKLRCSSVANPSLNRPSNHAASFLAL